MAEHAHTTTTARRPRQPRGVPSRPRIEAAIAALIDLLDEADAPLADLEPQPGEDCGYRPVGLRDTLPGDPLDAEPEAVA